MAEILNLFLMWIMSIKHLTLMVVPTCLSRSLCRDRQQTSEKEEQLLHRWVSFWPCFMAAAGEDLLDQFQKFKNKTRTSFKACDPWTVWFLWESANFVISCFWGPGEPGARYENCHQRIYCPVWDSEYWNGSEQPGPSKTAEGTVPGGWRQQQQRGRRHVWVRLHWTETTVK